GRIEPDDREALVGYWLEVMRAQPELSRVALGRESGEGFFVRRFGPHEPEGGRLIVGRFSPNRDAGPLELSIDRVEGAGRRRARFFPNVPGEAFRDKPWFVAAKKAGRLVWSDSHLLYGESGIRDIPGVTCAAPVTDCAGKFVGVVSSS